MATELQLAQTLKTKFESGKLRRVIHVDGAIGGMTPRLDIHMAVYSEHRVLPDGSTVSVNPSGTITEVMSDDPGILLREIEADLILSQASAVALRDWLSLQINQMQAVQLQLVKQQSE